MDQNSETTDRTCPGISGIRTPPDHETSRKTVAIRTPSPGVACHRGSCGVDAASRNKRQVVGESAATHITHNSTDTHNSARAGSPVLITKAPFRAAPAGGVCGQHAGMYASGHQRPAVPDGIAVSRAALPSCRACLAKPAPLRTDTVSGSAQTQSRVCVGIGAPAATGGRQAGLARTRTGPTTNEAARALQRRSRLN